MKIDDANGRVALVTGAGPNNGLAIAMALAADGSRVAVSDLNAENARAGAAAVIAAGHEAIAVPFDVTDLGAVRAGVAKIEAELGTVEILVNNAGTIERREGRSGGQLGPFVNSDPEIWHRWIDLNIYGSLHCVHTVLPGMIGRRWGRVVQISSTAGSRGLASGHSLYGAGKAGIEAALRHIALETAADGITLNSLALGSIAMANAASNPQLDALRASIPIGRQGRAEEVGAMVAWLASDAAEWITGQTIHVNGGGFQGR